MPIFCSKLSKDTPQDQISARCLEYCELVTLYYNTSWLFSSHFCIVTEAVSCETEHPRRFARVCWSSLSLTPRSVCVRTSRERVMDRTRVRVETHGADA